jgi:small GTP-binding protein
MNDPACIRLIVIGDSRVGKTQMMVRFMDDDFDPQGSSTVGVDFKTKPVILRGVPRKIQIWDTAGQERFRNITEAYYRKGHGIAIVYDVSERTSFDHVPGWFDSVQTKCGGIDPVPIVLIANKADLIPIVSEEEGEKLAAERGVHFFQTSAKSGSNIEEAFLDLAADADALLQRKRPSPEPPALLVERAQEPGSEQRNNCGC